VKPGHTISQQKNTGWGSLSDY